MHDWEPAWRRLVKKLIDEAVDLTGPAAIAKIKKARAAWVRAKKARDREDQGMMEDLERIVRSSHGSRHATLMGVGALLMGTAVVNQGGSHLSAKALGTLLMAQHTAMTNVRRDNSAAFSRCCAVVASALAQASRMTAESPGRLTPDELSELLESDVQEGGGMRDGLATGALELSREVGNILDLLHDNPLKAIRNAHRLREAVRRRQEDVQQEVLMRQEVSHTTEAERQAVRSFCHYLLTLDTIRGGARKQVEAVLDATEADLAVAITLGRHMGRRM